jgi:hypothetical protein
MQDSCYVGIGHGPRCLPKSPGSVTSRGGRWVRAYPAAARYSKDIRQILDKLSSLEEKMAESKAIFILISL